jgi:hypothetical protein
MKPMWFALQEKPEKARGMPGKQFIVFRYSHTANTLSALQLENSLHKDYRVFIER